MQWIISLYGVLVQTILDVAPIVAIILGFQWLVIRRPIPNLSKLIAGLIYVVLGMTLFIEGLQQALFPLGKIMATQLTNPVFILGDATGSMSEIGWQDYFWVYIFAAAIGFSTAIAEPALIAVGLKAEQVSGGTITTWELRIAVAIGVAFGVALGSYRIIAGIPIYYFIIAGYLIVMVQTLLAPRVIIPLAYDSGGVATSTVTVPLVAALGLGLAGTVPGRSPLVDGFGLIAFACLFPIITVLGYAQLSAWRARRG